ncbi:hypothetical protein PCE1_001617 [Barthelona sp. PCE]
MPVDNTTLQQLIEVKTQEFRNFQMEYSKLTQKRQELIGRYNENRLVVNELNKLKSEDEEPVTYQKAGPALMVKDIHEIFAETNRKSQLIKNETDKLEKAIEEKQNELALKNQDILEFKERLENQSN